MAEKISYITDDTDISVFKDEINALMQAGKKSKKRIAVIVVDDSEEALDNLDIVVHDVENSLRKIDLLVKKDAVDERYRESFSAMSKKLRFSVTPWLAALKNL